MLNHTSSAPRSSRRWIALSLVTLLVACAESRGSLSAGTAAVQRSVEADSAFARLITQLSEPGGYFDTDNLISNETSYLHVVGKLEELTFRGGAYIGVGPDQNFSYIGHVRPYVAFIIDIRRDNLLQHLLFKSLFSLSRNRIDYLCLLFARTCPADIAGWDKRDVGELIDYIDSAATNPDHSAAVLATVAERSASFGLELTAADLQTIRAFHSTFIREGLGLRFSSHGRRPRSYYPTYRQLLLERDLSGRQASYLASEADFQFIKRLQENDLIVPVVGDLAGEHALVAIGREIAKRGLAVSAFYTSNVEYYIMRDRGFDRFIANVGALPYNDRSVIIRSFFGRNFGYLHPQAVSGYYSVQLLQNIDELLNAYAAGGYRSYFDLITNNVIELGVPARATGN